MSLIKSIFHRPVLVVVLSLLGILLGLLSLTRMPIELYPSQETKTVSIITRVRGGISSSEVERFITNPIEEHVAKASYLKDMTSISREGESIVILYFDDKAVMDLSMRELRDAIAIVRAQLPDEADHPIIAQYNYHGASHMLIGILSSNHSLNQLHELIEDDIKPELLKAQGVAHIEIGGGQEKKILVDIDQSQLRKHNLSFDYLMQLIGHNNVQSYSGSIDGKTHSVAIRMRGLLKDLDDLRNLPVYVNDQKQTVRLSDIANVYEGYLKRVDHARLNQNPTINLSIKRKSDSNPINTSNAINAQLSILKKDYPQLSFTTVFDESQEITHAIKSIRASLLWGLFLVLTVLLVLLRYWQLMVVLISVMFVSLLSSLFVMDMLSISLNVMSLSALALGIGLLSDNIIVLFESFRQDKVSNQDDVIHSTNSVAPALFSSCLTTMIVFLPLIYTSSSLQKTFSSLALTVVVVLIISLTVSLSLGSIIFSKLASSKNKTKSIRFPLASIMRDTSKFLPLIWGLIICLLIFSAWIYKQKGMGLERLPSHEITVRITPPPGAKLEVVNDVIKELESNLLNKPFINHVSSQVRKMDPYLHIGLHKNVSISNTRKKVHTIISNMINDHDGFAFYFDRALDSKTQRIGINILGSNDDVVTTLGQNIAKQLGKTGQFNGIQVSNKQFQREYHIYIDRTRASLYGLSVSSIADELHAKVRGMRASKFFDHGNQIEIITRLDKENVLNIKDVLNLTLYNDLGKPIALRQVASIMMHPGAVAIYHQNRYRTFQVTVEPLEENLIKAKNQLQMFLSKVSFLPNYFYEFDRKFLDLLNQQKQLTFALVLAIIAIYLVLAALLESWILPLIVLSSVVLSVIGVAIMMWVLDFRVTQGVLIGLMMLVGLVVNNAILLIYHLEHQLKNSYQLIWIIYRAVRKRVKPIALTTLTTILSLLPMAIGKGENSLLWQPMAQTMIGGLIVSSILVLIVVPSLWRLTKLP